MPDQIPAWALVRFRTADEPMPKIAHMLGIVALTVSRYVEYDHRDGSLMVYYASQDRSDVRCAHYPTYFNDAGHHIMTWLQSGDSILPGWPDPLPTCDEIDTPCTHVPALTVLDPEDARE